MKLSPAFILLTAWLPLGLPFHSSCACQCRALLFICCFCFHVWTKKDLDGLGLAADFAREKPDYAFTSKNPRRPNSTTCSPPAGTPYNARFNPHRACTPLSDCSFIYTRMPFCNHRQQIQQEPQPPSTGQRQPIDGGKLGLLPKRPISLLRTSPPPVEQPTPQKKKTADSERTAKSWNMSRTHLRMAESESQ
ncbi:hypothetical protein CPB85DRAFT_679443 [Mucidula mucida]|nr:hypothetical protein CPB85DRAFT_679443 [Mucidula mucida]